MMEFEIYDRHECFRKRHSNLADWTDFEIDQRYE